MRSRAHACVCVNNRNNNCTDLNRAETYTLLPVCGAQHACVCVYVCVNEGGSARISSTTPRTHVHTHKRIRGGDRCTAHWNTRIIIIMRCKYVCMCCEWISFSAPHACKVFIEVTQMSSSIDFFVRLFSNLLEMIFYFNLSYV